MFILISNDFIHGYVCVIYASVVQLSFIPLCFLQTRNASGAHTLSLTKHCICRSHFHEYIEEVCQKKKKRKNRSTMAHIKVESGKSEYWIDKSRKHLIENVFISFSIRNNCREPRSDMANINVWWWFRANSPATKHSTKHRCNAR